MAGEEGGDRGVKREEKRGYLNGNGGPGESAQPSTPGERKRICELFPPVRPFRGGGVDGVGGQRAVSC